MYYPLTQDYFTVYQSNAHLIGEIQNEDLRGLIILTYSAAKGVVDSYRYNNHIVEKHEHWDWVAAETKNPLHVVAGLHYDITGLHYGIVSLH